MLDYSTNIILCYICEYVQYIRMYGSEEFESMFKSVCSGITF